jgi:uncharacterized protein
MKIAIISDVHNNTTNLKKVLNYCSQNKIEKIICCGDLASLETLDFLNDNFSGEIYYCFGNMDDDYLQNYKTLQKYKNTNIYKNFGEVEIENRKAAFVHYPDKAKGLCKMGKYDFVFYGHTHKPWIEKINNCTMLNPGNVAGELYPPTFAVWDTKNNSFSLIRVNEL